MAVNTDNIENRNNDYINDRTGKCKEVDYDALLSTAGEFGKYQWFLFCSTFPFYIFASFVYFVQIFITETSPNHWCWVPELENLTQIERRELAIPMDSNSRFGYSQCSVYIANWTEILYTGIQTPNQSWTTEPCQHGWEFNKSEIPYSTISSELGWVCERGSYQASAQMIFFIGSIFGGFLIGWVADRYGRLPAAVAANMIACIAGIATTFSTNFFDFAIYRFFVGMGYDNCMAMVFVLVLEYVAPKYRSIMANLPFALFFCLGIVTLPWIALACNHWKVLSLASSVPLSLALLSPIILPESPRWLLSKGRVDDAVDKIKNIGEINRKEIPQKMIEQFKETVSKRVNEENSIFELIKRPTMRKMFICICLVYMCNMLVFDALVRTLGQLKYDFFVSFTVASLTELPSLLILSFVLDITGRRWMVIVSMLICCVFSLMAAFIGGGLPSVLCAVIARFVINMSCNTGMQWAVEILPTPVRGSGAAFIHICGYVATAIAPFVAYLEVVTTWLPLVVTALIAAIAASLGLFLPETAKKEMPQTFDDSEELMRSWKMWDRPWAKKLNHTSGELNPSFEMN